MKKLSSKGSKLLGNQHFALNAIAYYRASVHADVTTARVILTKPPRPCVLEEELQKLGWKTYDIDPTDRAFKRIVMQATSRVVVMTPFFDGVGANWLKDLFDELPAGLQKVLILRSLEQPTRPDYPRGFDTLATWLRDHQVHVYNYSLPRLESFGRETFHAKVVLVDDRVAYVGSSNVNAASLEHSMEMGVELAGKAARDVAVVVDAVLCAAVRIF